jgi:hypothetical protein
MAYENTKRPRGRPAQHKADQLRAMYWFHCIVDGYENLSAYTLERLVIPEKVHVQKGSTSRPGLFDDYRDGKKVPLDNDQKNSIVAITDDYFRGSAKIFRNPIWNIFKEKSVSREEVLAALDDLGAIVELLFLEPAAKYGLKGILIKSFKDEDFDAIQRVPFGSVFRAIMLMIYHFDSISNLSLRNQFAELYRKMIPDFVMADEIPFFHRFFDLADEITFRREFGPFNEEKIVKISWRNIYPEIAALPEQKPKKTR